MAGGRGNGLAGLSNGLAGGSSGCRA